MFQGLALWGLWKLHSLAATVTCSNCARAPVVAPWKTASDSADLEIRAVIFDSLFEKVTDWLTDWLWHSYSPSRHCRLLFYVLLCGRRTMAPNREPDQCHIKVTRYVAGTLYPSLQFALSQKTVCLTLWISFVVILLFTIVVTVTLHIGLKWHNYSSGVVMSACIGHFCPTELRTVLLSKSTQ